MNGVKQDHSVPGKMSCGVGRGVAYPVSKPGSMGSPQYKPASPPYTNKGHDGHNNTTYK